MDDDFERKHVSVIWESNDADACSYRLTTRERLFIDRDMRQPAVSIYCDSCDC
jgi:hypothetical protein